MDMKTVNEYRRDNLIRLVAALGGTSDFARALGKSSSQISQWVNASPDSKTGKPRQISDSAARQIEAACRLARGWMDQPHDDEELVITKTQTHRSAALTPTIEFSTKMTTIPLTPPENSKVIAWEKFEELPAGAYVQVPHYDVEISAGDGCQWVDHADNEPLAFRARWFKAKGLKPQDCRAIYVRGDSMVPTLKDGDTVLIDITKT